MGAVCTLTGEITCKAITRLVGFGGVIGSWLHAIGVTIGSIPDARRMSLGIGSPKVMVKSIESLID